MQASKVKGADICGDLIAAVVSVNEPDPKRAENTKAMIKQLFLSGASENDLQRACMAAKAVIDKYADAIEGFKKDCKCTETEKPAPKEDNIFGL